mmetsp:Transcript_67861/g.174901  ORF Transcript_67861/g.174901 Transcript_67861/m.174901 type:complete len:382 (+) Transcript_67861:12-1157(+)
MLLHEGKVEQTSLCVVEGVRDGVYQQVRRAGAWREAAVLDLMPVLRPDQGQEGLVEGLQQLRVWRVLLQKLDHRVLLFDQRKRRHRADNLQLLLDLVEKLLGLYEHVCQLCAAQELPTASVHMEQIARTGCEAGRAHGLPHLLAPRPGLLCLQPLLQPLRADVHFDLVQLLVDHGLDRRRQTQGQRLRLQLLVDVHQHVLLRAGGLRDAQPLHDHRARGRVDQQGETRYASHVEEHAVRVELRDLAVGPLDAHLDGESQPHGAAQAAPGHDDCVGPSHGRPVGAEPLQDRAREEDDHKPHDGQDHVEVEQVHVVLERDCHHRLRSQRACEEEDQRVAEVLEDMPNLVHGLLADHGRPNAVREDQGCRHRREHAADPEDALS